MPSRKLIGSDKLTALITLAEEWHHGCPCCGCWIATLKDAEAVVQVKLPENDRIMLAGALAVEAKARARG